MKRCAIGLLVLAGACGVSPSTEAPVAGPGDEMIDATCEMEILEEWQDAGAGWVEVDTGIECRVLDALMIKDNRRRWKK